MDRGLCKSALIFLIPSTWMAWNPCFHSPPFKYLWYNEWPRILNLHKELRNFLFIFYLFFPTAPKGAIMETRTPRPYFCLLPYYFGSIFYMYILVFYFLFLVSLRIVIILFWFYVVFIGEIYLLTYLLVSRNKYPGN